MILGTWFLVLLLSAIATAFVHFIKPRHRRIEVERRQAQGLEAAFHYWFDEEHSSNIAMAGEQGQNPEEVVGADTSSQRPSPAPMGASAETIPTISGRIASLASTLNRRK